ncbi:unnamed protein product [Protopolystoma xenopodis]|uniref:G-protein coupled receptors family 1 profile domain-containing protein n=1 Tax=Protopolystoma xenopodis TaxID=117903 RepID=A0A3S5CTG1_9PLAT|nr:unnamed protein product [Protopolystoma xenopodis]
MSPRLGDTSQTRPMMAKSVIHQDPFVLSPRVQLAHKLEPRDYSDLVGFYRAYITPWVFVVGLLGNISVLVTFGLESPGTRFSVYAMALATAHLVALIFNSLLDDFLGRGLLYLTHQRVAVKLDSFSDVGCKLMEYIPKVAYFAAAYILVVFSLDRLVTVHRPFQFYSIYHRRLAWLACLAIGLTSLVVNLPSLFVQRLVVDPISRTNFTCRMEEAHRLTNAVIGFHVFAIFTLPVGLVLLANLAIWRRLYQLRRRRRALMPAEPVHSRLEMARVSGHLALSTCFLLLYIPLVCLVLLRLYLTLSRVDRHDATALRIIDLSRLFSSLKDVTYAVNFFLYFAFLANFRKRFLRVFCLWPRQPKHETKQTVVQTLTSETR